VHDCQPDTLRPKIAIAEAEVFSGDKLIRWQAVNSISNHVEILLHFEADLFDANLLNCGWMEAAMRLTVRPEGLMERIALLFNLAPLPLVDTQIAFSNARAIMAAASLGVFEQLGQGDKTVDEIAAACNTNPEATKHLLNCLVGVGYARWSNGKYGMQRAHRKWLLRSSPSSLVDKLIFQLHEWDLMGNLEDFVRTGKSVDFHSSMSPAQWAVYQDGMRDVAAGPAVELAKKLPVPDGASRLLDIGGSHGLYSIELCKRYGSLKSTILELPGAIDRASAIAAREGLADRVQFRTGNALTDDLGQASFDIVMINNVAHHFTPAQNIELAKRVARALTPGGIYSVGEFLRAAAPGEGGSVPATMDLYFALTSASGTWSLGEITSWQREAGLTPRTPIQFPSLPGWVAAPATRPS
jgi:SAM-dependent methyltransferase